MSIDLTGIDNQHEFYTHHYLSAILEDDLKDVFRKWRERDEQEKVRPPFAALRALYKDYFTVKSQLERQKGEEQRLESQRELEKQLLDILGYPFAPTTKELDDGSVIPILGEVKKPNGAPELWVLEAIDDPGEEQDPLTLRLRDGQYGSGQSVPQALAEATLDELITRWVFGRAEPPRWVLLVSASQVVLIDRGKWNEKRLLRFDLTEILGRREATTLQATAALLHRDSVCPQEGMSLLDNLDENSHKHAHAVSEDLKYALREAIELLGNEAVFYLKEKRKKGGVFEGSKDEIDATQLTLECLRYMYRLLFLFYIEARPELGYAPIKADAYRMGYSLESLRDIELVKLTTEESKNGTFLSDSLDQLFRLIYDGFQPREKGMRQLALAEEGKPLHNTFQLTPLRTHLFDPKRTPTLNKVKVRNAVMQRIVELMSLSRPKGRRERRGRVSYAQLGINQLGAVYEALLSFSGFFAQTDLYEVKKAGEKADELATAYFVPEEDLKDYTEEERVYNEDGTLRKYEKGTFIYRLAGRFRETSASYYTPEVLTQCLVKYALKELLPGKTADEVLHLTVCEPAMGSAAFLNEAINQLADAYLDLKQKEVGRKLLVTAPKPEEQDANDPYRQTEDYAIIKQRVKTFMADNNVFGVDLNPVAVELAEVSLWLNTMAPGGFIPWFGNQLACGNSLVGARRQVFKADLLTGKKAGWLDAVPERVQVGKPRPAGSVYHFLLGDKGMSVYGEGNEGKPIREMAAKELKTIKDWRQEFCQPLSKEEVEALQELSDAIDKLWDAHVEMQARIRERTTDPMHVWGQSVPENMRPPTTTEWKDRVLKQEMFSKDVRASSPYRRLKLAMDYWCALWFWPIEKADLLPSRGEFLLELSLILRGDVLEVSGRGEAQLPLFSETQPKEEARQLIDEFGYVNVDKLCESYPRLALVREIAEELQRFLHWEVEFADQFAATDGFQLLLGNPPWIKIEWEERAVLSDADPTFAIRKLSAADTAKRRASTLQHHERGLPYFSSHEAASGMCSYLCARQCYPELVTAQPNIYKGFITLAWLAAAPNGVTALLHPEGVYDDAKGGALRRAIHPRLRRHYQFQNEKKLFPDVHNETKFSINVYGSVGVPKADTISNLFTPSTVDGCYEHDGRGPIPGIRDDNGDWNTAAHRDRIVQIGPDTLTLFAAVYDEPGTPPEEARLPALQSRHLLGALRRAADASRTLASISDYRPTKHWDETYATKDGTIRRATKFPSSVAELILSGPHFYIGNPLQKTPRRICNTNKAYDIIDLTAIPDNYLPRTNYVPGCDIGAYQARTPRVPWAGGANSDRVSDYARVVVNNMIRWGRERTLQPAIIPAGAAHVHTVNSYAFKSTADMVLVAGTWMSLPIDFLVKTTGAEHFQPNLARRLFVPDVFHREIRLRALAMNCLTSHYSDVWAECWEPAFSSDAWGAADSRLPCDYFANLTDTWERSTGLRSDILRREALVELDVLVGMALGLRPEELGTMYRAQFYLMRIYERDTWYDHLGRIVYTANSTGLPGVGLPRTSRDGPCWEDVKTMQSGTVEHTVMDDTLPGGPRKKTIVYHAPFDRCDRERDYEVVWAEFEKRYGKVRTKK
jgi:hypothetical protein